MTTIPRSRQHNTTATATLFEMREHHCVYSHHIGDALFYIGVCKLHELFKFPDAFKNSIWRVTVKEDTEIRISMAFTSDSLIECNNMQAQMIAAFRPIANIQGFLAGGNAAITCVIGPNAGKVYANQQLAAVDNGISQPTLSNHLNGRPGYDFVRGMKFKRGM